MGRSLVFGVVVLMLSGCVAPSNVYHSSTALPASLKSSVLILPPDVVVSVLNAGGTTEPRADWSAEVRTGLIEALQGHLYAKGVRFIPYDGADVSDDHLDVMRQANVMMDAVELAQAKQGIGSQRIYALGKGSREALRQYDADYVLVSVVRANQASGGRTAVAILGAVAGVAVETNAAEFRVGLFDLRDGQLKWANFDAQALPDIGNLVDASDADWSEAVAHLLTEMPL